MLYRDVCGKMSEYTHWIVVRGSSEDKISNWLNRIKNIAHDNSTFYGIGYICKGSECGWYVEKEKVLDELHSTFPKTNDSIMKHDALLALNDIWDYILDYKQPMNG
jgi:hypothetical protein